MKGGFKMEMKMITVTLGTWFLFMILAIINAGIRNGVYKPIVGDLTAHQISTLIFAIVIFVVTYLILRFSDLNLSDSQALFMGITWVILTIGFEFIAGHYAFGNSWEKLLADYNILNGRIWSLVLLIEFIAPLLSNFILRR